MLSFSVLGNGKALLVCSVAVNQISGNQLGLEIFHSLRKQVFSPLLVDYGLPVPRTFTRGVVLALSLGLIKILNQKKVGKRVGVILPPGIGGFVANIAIILSGRIPVNLNFTLGSEINKYLLNSTGINAILTASKMIEKFPDFPWTEEIILVDNYLLSSAKRPFSIFLEIIKAKFFPYGLVRKYQISQKGGHELATILFTSGSSGMPKGVMLSHENILKNCKQLFDLELFDDRPNVLVNLPLFHSFGFTVGMIFSVLRGLPLACTANPLDHKLNLKVIQKEKIKTLLGTPTFLRGYLKRAKNNELSSIKYVVAGAEKSPEEFRLRWEKVANCDYLEGYGLTEASPAISFNLPGRGKRNGSVGRLLKGVSCKTLDIDSGKETNLSDGGILCFRGQNIFAGYLNNQEKTSSVLDTEGWFKTGDLGRIDEDGFLWIEGRVSRFSKIGGEMVSHQKVEEAINKILGLCTEEDLQLVVSARENIQKGEQLVVVTTLALNLQDLKKALREQGLPNLWIPQEIMLLKEIPLLPTGKVNWKEIRSEIA
ncbi:MAG: AMP-dependent synthetase [Opitutae bacterium]|nr:AMP-dependent synthetase [Opitutae bacterium]